MDEAAPAVTAADVARPLLPGSAYVETCRHGGWRSGGWRSGGQTSPSLTVNVNRVVFSPDSIGEVSVQLSAFLVLDDSGKYDDNKIEWIRLLRLSNIAVEN